MFRVVREKQQTAKENQLLGQNLVFEESDNPDNDLTIAADSKATDKLKKKVRNVMIRTIPIFIPSKNILKNIINDICHSNF